MLRYTKRPVGRGSDGFSLAEVLLAIGLLAVALLALIAQSTLLAKANQKQDDSAVASDVAQGILERIIRQAEQDPAANQNLWGANSATTALISATEKVGFTEYRYQLFVSDVTSQVTGQVVGTGSTGSESPDTRLKRLEIKVEWWGGEVQTHSEAGKLSVEAARLCKVTRATP